MTINYRERDGYLEKSIRSMIENTLSWPERQYTVVIEESTGHVVEERGKLWD